MKNGNILVLGNSGVGKSTLINSVLGENKTKTSRGTKGTTSELEIFTNDSIPFCLIDTVGFEPSYFKEKSAINAVKKWNKECIKENEDNQINLIWFCVEGTAGKLFPKSIKNLLNAISLLKSVPIIIVITKSYSRPEREANIKMVKEAFEKYGSKSNTLIDIIPVIAESYYIDDDICAPPEGIEQLIEISNNILPEGKKATESDIAKYTLKRKRAFAQSLVVTSTTSASIVGAVPIPFADAAVLVPLETLELSAIAKIYGIKKDENSIPFMKSIIEAGTVSVAAKSIISALKSIPGINIATSLLNAAIAGIIVTAIGEVSIYAYEQVYLGKKTLKDVDWVSKLVYEKLESIEITKKAENSIKKLTKDMNP